MPISSASRQTSKAKTAPRAAVDVSKKLPFDTRNDLARATRGRAADILNQTLADLADLQSQIKQAHWNVKGPSFYGLHVLFDDIAGRLTEPVDTVAERVLALGGFARGTVRMAAGASGIEELPEEFKQQEIVGDIADRVAHAAKRIRERIDATEDLGDKVTSDLLTNIAATLDKALYFLEAYQFRSADDSAPSGDGKRA